LRCAAVSPRHRRPRPTPRAQQAAPPHHPFSPAPRRAGGRASVLMFTHLHTHTEYSLLDGLSRIPILMDRAKDLGQEAIGLTDHGVLYGAIQFYKEAKARGIKPIIGIEAYVAQGSRFSREPHDKQPYHM